MGEGGMIYVKSESEGNKPLIQLEESHMPYLVHPELDAQPLVDNTSFSEPPLCPAPLCRQFWKAGNYDDEFVSKSRVQNSNNYLHVHPKFLHSNATSHKWAFGAIAELLDNAIDEIQNGASYVIIDKTSNPRDGSPSLLFQDNGGGMSPEAIRRCMSFGFSDKKSKSAIGRYGNGFKTSTMRLGADVIVFSRHVNNGTTTQSIGLLSYTYLSQNGLDRIVVPMVDYKYNESTDTFIPLPRYHGEQFQSSKSIILQWSPYCNEVDLMKQFDDIGSHGTKVVVFNLWFTDDETLEFEFDSDPQDICLQGSDDCKNIKMKNSTIEEHIGIRYHHSLRVYLSILYLKIPQSFTIVLRGKAVEHHNVASDLKYPEFILYRPHTGGTKEAEVLATIGFIKEAPHVNIHGFCVYHKNRLILPYWQVVSYDRSRGRGVVGVLEANFIEPTHNKQDFERTSLFLKLEARLKEMAWEYWDFHCGLIGYQIKKPIRAPVSSLGLSDVCPSNARHEPLETNKSLNFGRAPIHQADPVVNLFATSVFQSDQSIQQRGTKRTQEDVLFALDKGSVHVRTESDINNAGCSVEVQPASQAANLINEKGAVVMMQENKSLLAKCLEYEKAEEELNNKVLLLSKELKLAQHEYERMLIVLQSLEAVKPELDV
ncbi:protein MICRORCHIDIA 6-like isoform X1 [Chenopodium quinoa]|uniref:protein MICRORCHIDIA 6-like isoform X1 n=1 Tax=Chenopodium quinoa TaxID=63459 RepID=UPI000B778BA8|nr:protein MICRORCHIDIA 6-like isoform X1 [Chenopodium quinoa]XP_021733590.1 protein MICRORCHIDIA 6-like isoform X1 [Chenopodium quinoa]XP_021733591.1 protein MICRORCHIDIA 6-like isoform X1 [Chenopodium quinoa]XP_021733592.1 protein MICRORCHIDIA 6-like isoform X1 [Chenopodium quinoa]